MILLVVHYVQEVEKFKFLLNNLDYQVIVDTRAQYSNAKKWTFQQHEQWFVKKRPWWYLLSRFIDHHNFFHYTLVHQHSYYKDRPKISYPWYVKLIIFLRLNRLKIWSKLKYLYKPDNEVYLRLQGIDELWVTSLAFLPFHVDQEFVIAAKHLKIPVYSFITNWDGLTTKSVIFPKADKIFCWNDFHEQELIKYHDISKEQIYKIGAFPFEKWLTKIYPENKEKWFKKWGLDASKPLYVYVGSSQTIAKEEKINLTFEQLVVREHPDKPIDWKLKIPKQGELLTDNEAFLLAYNTYYYAEAILGINTSAMLEASIINKNIVIVPGGENHAQNSLHFKGVEFNKNWLFQDDLPSNLIKKWL